MIKFSFGTAVTVAAGLAVATPSIALADVSAPVSMDHGGTRYTYTVEQKGKVRIIRGKTDQRSSRFVLYVGRQNVTGRFNGSVIAFKLSDVKPSRGIVEVASR